MGCPSVLLCYSKLNIQLKDSDVRGKSLLLAALSFYHPLHLCLHQVPGVYTIIKIEFSWLFKKRDQNTVCFTLHVPVCACATVSPVLFPVTQQLLNTYLFKEQTVYFKDYAIFSHFSFSCFHCYLGRDSVCAMKQM